MQVRRNQIIFFVAVLVVFTGLWWLVYGRDGPGRARFQDRVVRLKQVFDAARLYDTNNGTGYPHLRADLIDKDYLEPTVFGLPANWTKKAGETTQTSDDGRVQHVGDFWFAPLVQPARSARVIFGWTKRDDRDVWAILFEDGHVEIVPGDPSEVFAREAPEREKKGLPAYTWNAD